MAAKGICEPQCGYPPVPPLCVPRLAGPEVQYLNVVAVTSQEVGMLIDHLVATSRDSRVPGEDEHYVHEAPLEELDPRRCQTRRSGVRRARPSLPAPFNPDLSSTAAQYTVTKKSSEDASITHTISSVDMTASATQKPKKPSVAPSARARTDRRPRRI